MRATSCVADIHKANFGERNIEEEEEEAESGGFGGLHELVMQTLAEDEADE